MKTAKWAISIAAAFTCVIAVASAQAATDPRKCASSGGHISAGPVVDGPTFCAYQAAQLAFRRYMTAVSHATVIYSAPMTCTQGATNLVWTCDFGAGKGTITFKALSSGWHTRVAVTCGDPVMKPATSCH
jgi:hypothetical protein